MKKRRCCVVAQGYGPPFPEFDSLPEAREHIKALVAEDKKKRRGLTVQRQGDCVSLWLGPKGGNLYSRYSISFAI